MRGERAYSTLQPNCKRTVNAEVNAVEFSRDSEFDTFSRTVRVEFFHLI